MSKKERKIYLLAEVYSTAQKYYKDLQLGLTTIEHARLLFLEVNGFLVNFFLRVVRVTLLVFFIVAAA